MLERTVTGNEPMSAECVTFINNKIVHTQHMFYINLKSYMFRPSSGCTFQKHEREINVQGDPREPDMFKTNSTQLFFK